MMAVVEPGRVAEFLAVCAKWDVRAAVIGEVTDTGRLVMTWHGETVADLPPGSAADGPVYARPLARPAAQDTLAADDPAVLESVDFQTGMNLCKVNASELALATVMSAMQACGLAGYRNDGDFSVGRHLRDILSSPIMISNDRILANLAMASLLGGAPASLRD